MEKNSLHELYRDIGEVTATSRTILASLDKIFKTLESMDSRLTVLENKELQRTAKIATIATVASVSLSILIASWNHILGFFSRGT